ncbi:hypothetical protein ACPCIR_08370 [Mycobacterium sp. NPDC051198]
MSLPPPPDPFGSQPPTGGGQPVGGTPQQWQEQPGGPAGPPTSGPPPAGPPPWAPQQQWTGGPPPPNNGGGKAKWILGGLAVVLAIALTAVITVLLVKPDSGGSGSSNAGADGSKSEFASANDTGPVNIITEDPTCEAWGRVSREYAAKTDAVSWGDRDPSLPATAWTTEQRAMYDTAGKALTDAANETVNLVKVTPHRVVRELYTQFIVNGRDFVSKIPEYTSQDQYVSGVAHAAANGLAGICSAIDFRSAQPIAPLLPAPSAPSKESQPTDPEHAERFLTQENPVCPDWSQSVDQFDTDTAAWRSTDPNIPASEWTSEVRTIHNAVVPTMSANADNVERLGRQSSNATLEDLAVLAAQYERGYVKAIPTYKPADNFLTKAAFNLVKAVNSACKAAS